MSLAQIQSEALTRAVSGKSTANWTAILQGFMAKGIDADDIRPRENVFTYRAWQALGRQVRKGESGVRVCTFAPIKAKRDAQTGEIVKPGGKRPWFTTVFHVSQTDAIQPLSASGDALPDSPAEELASTDTEFSSAA